MYTVHNTVLNGFICSDVSRSCSILYASSLMFTHLAWNHLSQISHGNQLYPAVLLHTVHLSRTSGLCLGMLPIPICSYSLTLVSLLKEKQSVSKWIEWLRRRPLPISNKVNKHTYAVNCTWAQDGRRLANRQQAVTSWPYPSLAIYPAGRLPLRATCR